MNTYSKTSRTKINYRKIYTEHYGPIPKDSAGRQYDIHHIDGNSHNNEPCNLKAVSIQEHYDIHHYQEDWGACLAIARRMKKSPELISELARRNALARVANGTNPFVGGELAHITNKRRVKDGTHNFLGPENNRKKVEAGTHHFLGGEIQSKSNQRRLKNGTHHLLGGAQQRALVASGRHPFQNKELHKRMIQDGTHHSCQILTCPHCGIVGKGSVMKRWHFTNCKIK